MKLAHIPPNFKTCILVVIALLLTPAPGSSDVDLHRMWDDRCFECHGHAAEFARRSLSVSEGELQGRHHVHDLRRFMLNHYPADSEVDAVYDMLLAQASTQARFAHECSSCHQSAAEFVRRSMEFCDRRLCSRESDAPVRDFLEHHRAMDSKDIDYFMTLLTRIAEEIYRP